MDVHYSSGVYNKAFYLLANKSGWNTQEAFQAFARANRDYWTASTDFDQGACGVEQPATHPGFSEPAVPSPCPSVGASCHGEDPGAHGHGAARLPHGVTVTFPPCPPGPSLTFPL